MKAYLILGGFPGEVYIINRSYTPYLGDRFWTKAGSLCIVKEIIPCTPVTDFQEKVEAKFEELTAHLDERNASLWKFDDVKAYYEEAAFLVLGIDTTYSL